MSHTRHVIVSNNTQLGQRFITCSCGNVESSGQYDGYAQRNHAYHAQQAIQQAAENTPLVIDTLDLQEGGTGITQRDLLAYALTVGQDELMYGHGGDADPEAMSTAAADFLSRIAGPSVELTRPEARLLIEIVETIGNYADMCDYAEDGNEEQQAFGRGWKGLITIIQAGLEQGAARTWQVFGR